MAIARLDHAIQEVDDIESSRNAWLIFGLAEAWPIGPFWPDALTCGLGAGTANLELVQPLNRRVEEPVFVTAVFEPTSIEAAVAALRRLGIGAIVSEKVEPDPALLALRGFPEETCRTPQTICTNVIPDGVAPFSFFFCEYAPFLKERLDPSRAGQPGDWVLNRLTLPASDPDEADRWLSELGGCGNVHLSFASKPLSFGFGAAFQPR